MTMSQEIQKKIEEKKRVLNSARKVQNARKDIIDLFEKGIFHIGVIYLKQKKNKEKQKLI